MFRTFGRNGFHFRLETLHETLQSKTVWASTAEALMCLVKGIPLSWLNQRVKWII